MNDNGEIVSTKGAFGTVLFWLITGIVIASCTDWVIVTPNDRYGLGGAIALASLFSIVLLIFFEKPIGWLKDWIKGEDKKDEGDEDE